MESPLDTAKRLLAALEELVMQETMLIRTMDFIEAVEVQERAAPVIEKLCALTTDPSVGVLQGRVAALLERIGQNYHFLDNQLKRLQTELDRVTSARTRLRSIAPAYRSKAIRPDSILNTAA